MKTNFLLIVFVIFSLAAQADILVQMSAEDTLPQGATLYLHTGTTMLASLPDTAPLPAGATLVTRGFVPDDCFLLTTPDRATLSAAAATRWGQVLFREGNVALMRGAADAITIARAGLCYVPVHPITLPRARHWQPGATRSRDDIDDLIALVQPDTLEYVVQSLEDFQTRYVLAPNHREVAEWIRRRFIEVGIPEEYTMLDSFYLANQWHYNVIAYIPGTMQPNKYILVGGHHDSINNNGDPMVSAPGADDNASAVAAVTEIARICMATGYQPETTLVFATFTAEEEGLVGSQIMANAMASANLDILGMINADMIANNSDAPGSYQFGLCQYTGAEFLYDMALNVLQQHDEIALTLGLSSSNSGSSDSWSFWNVGYPAVYYLEREFSPYYHSSEDLTIHCDFDYSAEIVQLMAAQFVTFDRIPRDVVNLTGQDTGAGNAVLLSWQPSGDTDLDYYLIGVGTQSGQYTQFFQTTDTLYTATGLSTGQGYWFGVAGVDTDGNEGLYYEVNLTTQAIPRIPANVAATPEWQQVRIDWSPNTELDLAGYVVRRATSPEGTFTPIHEGLLTDCYTRDLDAEPGVFYWYTVAAQDVDGNESAPSEPVRSRAITLDQGILLVDDTIDGSGAFAQPTDADCDAFYATLLQGFAHDVMEADADNAVRLDDLCAYSTVIWYTDDNTNHSTLYGTQSAIEVYLNAGGNLLLSGFKPVTKLCNVTEYPHTFENSDYGHYILGIDQIDFQNLARFNEAITTAQAYPSVPVDSTKAPDALGYHIIGVEGLSTTQNIVTNIYGTAYEPTTTFGALADLTVVTLREDEAFKLALCTFPFYYMEPEPCRQLVQTILTWMDETPGAVDDPTATQATRSLTAWPNPFNPSTTVAFSLPRAGQTELAVYNIRGQRVRTLLNARLAAGEHTAVWNGRDDTGRAVGSGVYFCRLTSAGETRTNKVLLLK